MKVIWISSRCALHHFLYACMTQPLHPWSDGCVSCSSIFKLKRWKTCCLWKYISWRRTRRLPAQSKHVSCLFPCHISLHHSHRCPEQVVNHVCDIGFDWLWWRSPPPWINAAVWSLMRRRDIYIRGSKTLRECRVSHRSTLWQGNYLN